MRHHPEVGHHVLRAPGELRPALRILGGHPGRTGVLMADPGHYASQGDEGNGAEGELVRPQEGGDHHIPSGAQAPVHAQPHAVPEPAGYQHPVGLRQPDLPRHSRVLDRGPGRGPGPAGVAADQDDVRPGLGHAGRDHPHPDGGDQLHGDLGPRVDGLEVVDQLGQVLDAVDIVMWRRRDQVDAGLGEAQPGDLSRHLGGRQVPALAGLGALGHLDLELLGGDQVIRRDAEAGGGHLLGPAVPLGLVAVGILAALPAVGAQPQAVHGDGQGLVGLRGEGAVRHRRGGEAAEDRLLRLHPVQRDRRAVALPAQPIPQIHRLPMDMGGEGSVAAIGFRETLPQGLRGPNGLLERSDGLRVQGVELPARPVFVEPRGGELRAFRGEGRPMPDLHTPGDLLQADRAEDRRGPREGPFHQLPLQADDLEDLSPRVGIQGGDPHAGHHFEQALLDRLDVTPDRLLRASGAPAFAFARRQGGDGLEGQIGTDRRGAIPDQAGEMVDLPGLPGDRDQARLGPLTGPNQVMVHRADGQQGRDGGVGRVDRFIAEDQQGASLPNGLLGGPTQLLQGLSQSLRPRSHRPHHGERGGAEAGIWQGPQGGDLSRSEDRPRELDEASGLLIRVQQVAAGAQQHGQGHHPGLPQGIDGRVRHLGEALLEEIVKGAGPSGEHRQRRVIAHGADGLLTGPGHRAKQEGQLLRRVAERDLSPEERLWFGGRDIGGGLRETHPMAAHPLRVGTPGAELGPQGGGILHPAGAEIRC